ncbi:MAG TPA: hypothetical protein PLR60_11400 [Syntrophorhabdaceae bacterium]|nr:hypothetical protein [Syntrophorhabdaceae bacterium]
MNALLVILHLQSQLVIAGSFRPIDDLRHPYFYAARGQVPFQDISLPVAGRAIPMGDRIETALPFEPVFPGNARRNARSPAVFMFRTRTIEFMVTTSPGTFVGSNIVAR